MTQDGRSQAMHGKLMRAALYHLQMLLARREAAPNAGCRERAGMPPEVLRA